jgi:multisubunit Na+/H+ antiporter MnhF subunit
VSIWMTGAVVLVALLVPLAGVAAFGSPDDGLVALQMSSIVAAVALLLMAKALGRGMLADLALVLGVASFVGGLAYATLLEREP